jgi:penicillin amidase
MDKAGSLDEFRQAIRPWHVPLFSIVAADAEGHIAYQAAGRIPQRSRPERGYRNGADPADEWLGVIPFEHMPHVIDPPRGWVATANNRLAPADYPYGLFGCWQSGWRATRIRQMIEGRDKHSPDDMAAMHQDAISLRAAACVPALVSGLAGSDDPQVHQAAEVLRAWDNKCEPGSVAAAIFNVFFTQWCRLVAAERFEPDAVELMSKGVESCAMRLLRADPHGWFDSRKVGRSSHPSGPSPAAGRRTGVDGRIGNPSYGSLREQRIVEAMRSALGVLAARLGPDMSQWTWGRLHVMPLKHVLSSRGDLGQLLDHGGAGVRGDMTTVCNTGGAADWSATTGAGYRLIADLGVTPPKLLAVDAQSQSGHPGSTHYSDQFETWLAGAYHELPLDRAETEKVTICRLELTPS